MPPDSFTGCLSAGHHSRGGGMGCIMMDGITKTGYISPAEASSLSTAERRTLIRSGKLDCQTCATRKYQDGSNEMVSFKSPTHISPQAAGAAVRSHEQEHVANAYSKAAKAGNARVINASVSIQTSVCPECGRTYVSGGTTNTQIKYNDDAYAQNTKKQDQADVPGRNISMDV